MGKGSIVLTNSLGKDFHGRAAVDDLSLDISRGEIFGLVGPDGAGKTTTLRLLSAIMDPSRGEASVARFDTVRQSEEVKRRIGYMAQRFNLYRDLSVLENLDFYADVFEVGKPERHERIQRLLEFARLQEFQDRRAAHLSGGMQKKLALACTLIHTPQILFLDEPTTGVDPVSRREFWDILANLHIQGITLVITTPYMDEAERCSRVGFLYDGRLLECASPREIMEKVANEVIAIQPSDVYEARRLLKDLESVIQVQTYGNQLRLLTADTENTSIFARVLLESHGVDILSMRKVKPRMEEAYIFQVSRFRASASA